MRKCMVRRVVTTLLIDREVEAKQIIVVVVVIRLSFLFVNLKFELLYVILHQYY